jgi:cytochrome c biogenesis protein CcmG/thiol:disulfide interchange protein DsbE
MKKTLVPLALFSVLVVFLAIGLTRDPRQIPSPLIDKAAPLFNAARLGSAPQRFSPQDMRGQVWLLNVWASWCAACRLEHPIWLDFAQTKTVPIIGLNYKDQDASGLSWLARFGDPYDFSVTDPDGRIGIDYGVYGVPETFLIDQAGVIRYKQTGPMTQEDLDGQLLPLIRDLQK